MKRTLTYFTLLTILLSACASVKTNKSADAETYREDLSPHRISYTVESDTTGTDSAGLTEDYSEIEPDNDVTSQLNSVLAGSDELRQDIEEVDGFTIQIYVGGDTDEARKAKGQALAMFPDESVELFYDEPSFKVKVGQFYTRNEARSTYTKLQNKFPNALIIPDRIPIP